MKKIILTAYGSVNGFQETTVAMPTLLPEEILIKLVATSVDDSDVGMRQHGPFPTMPAEFRPTLPHMLGHDFSGIVTQVGNRVTKFAVGDHVVGFSQPGTYTEYLAVNQDQGVVKVPHDLDLVPLGGLILSGVTAWSAVIKNGQVQAGQRVLIHGGAGGVGSVAIQLAKAAGATVITTASAQHYQYLKNLGADTIIDYRTQDFTKLVHDVDLVVNLTGPQTLAQSYQVVKRGGRLTSVNGVPNPVRAKLHGIYATYAMGDPSLTALNELMRLYRDGQLTVNVSQTYPFTLTGIQQAHLDFEQGSNQGKRIITF
ncbi:MAG TPA: NADP-dependent oxidoreductase [Candidatus Levilactobacillus faecigallinarum]|uniref:NADP-dependent oxidoreductase n=1 Tax=Candidatus Levilactobacillus faecigallinarum TaxID=2838638 RepID=A0A9D1U5A7_9LACO|nr:NADP-dependent oxidoreductase [Candidatus Levilactobacillus faecigallinarum]